MSGFSLGQRLNKRYEYNGHTVDIEIGKAEICARITRMVQGRQFGVDIRRGLNAADEPMFTWGQEVGIDAEGAVAFGRLIDAAAAVCAQLHIYTEALSHMDDFVAHMTAAHGFKLEEM